MSSNNSSVEKMSWQDKMMNGLQQFATFKPLIPIRNGLAMIIPFTFIGSLFMIIGYLPIPGWSELIANYSYLFDSVVNCTFGILGLLAAFGIGYHMALQYKIDPFSNACMSAVAFILATLDGSFAINTEYLSSEGMFTAIIVAVLTTFIYKFFIDHRIYIRMPDSVPEAITRSFGSLLASAAIIVLVWLLRVVLKIDINGIIQMIFSPLMKGVDSFWGGLLYAFLMAFLWTLGIHGDLALSGVVTPIMLQLTAENTAALQAGQAIPHILSDSFVPMFVQFTGTGCTIGLVLLMLHSKCKRYKSLGKIALIPAIFNINEPVTFGFPIVMNPIMWIPFIGAQCITYILSYALTAAGIIGRICLEVSGFMPAPIGIFMATNGNIPAVIWGLLEIPLVTLIYYPFFKRMEKIELAEEAKAETDNQNNA